MVLRKDMHWLSVWFNIVSVISRHAGLALFLYSTFHCFLSGTGTIFLSLRPNGIVNVDDNRVGPLYNHVFPPEMAPCLSFNWNTLEGVLHIYFSASFSGDSCLKNYNFWHDHNLGARWFLSPCLNCKASGLQVFYQDGLRFQRRTKWWKMWKPFTRSWMLLDGPKDTHTTSQNFW